MPPKTVGGVTFQKTVHGDGRAESWRVFDMEVSLEIVNESHEHNGARFSGWTIDKQRGKAYQSHKAAMEASVDLVHEMVKSKVGHLEGQLRKLQGQIDQMKRFQEQAQRQAKGA